MGVLSPNGRLNRLQYFVQSFIAGLVFHVLVATYFIAKAIVVRTTPGVVEADDISTYSLITSPTFATLLVVLTIAGLICQWVLMVSQIKRLHDLNQSGWLVAINLIPGAGFFLWIVLVSAKGNDRTNADDLVAA